MEAKYGVWPTAKGFHASRSSSTLWHEICACTLEVITYARWILGDGWLANFWLDPWMADLPLSRWSTFINVGVLDAMRISYLL